MRFNMGLLLEIYLKGTPKCLLNQAYGVLHESF